MRVMAALLADVRFQLKQGFYIVYVLLTLLYMLLLGQLPDNIAQYAVPLIVFSDPSIVGFFFIGGIVMLEKVQGILQYIVVTPLRTYEYLISKVISLTFLAVAAGTAITALTARGSVNWLVLEAGIVLSSAFFTLYGFIAAAGCSSMNQYFIRMIPYMLPIVIPCFSIIDFPYSRFFEVLPPVAGLKLIMGAYTGISAARALILIIYLAGLNIIMLLAVEKVFEKRIITGGEGR